MNLTSITIQASPTLLIFKDARINVYASHLPMNYFSSLSNAGYNISITRLSDEFLVELSTHCPGSRWINRLAEWKLGPYYYSHITDYVRFCALYRWGGLYSDFDAVTLGRLDQFPDGFIGRDNARTEGHCEWCAWKRDIYLPPGVMAIAKPGHALVGTALEIGFDGEYNPNEFNSVGPKAVTMAYNKISKTRGFHVLDILEQHVLYPFDFLESQRVFAPMKPGEAKGMYERLKHGSLSLHLYGHMTRKLAIDETSILAEAFRALVLVDQDFRMTGPEYLAVGLLVEPVDDIRLIVPSSIVDDGNQIYTVAVSTLHGLVQVLSTELQDADSWKKKLTYNSSSPASMNRQLSRLVYYSKNLPKGRDEITISLTISDTSYKKQRVLEDIRIPVYDVESLVTVIVKTVGRMDKVIPLTESVRKYYKTVEIIVSDDHEEVYRSEGMSRGFYYLPLAPDVGLSAGRNTMVSRVKTEYFLTLDDDFTIDAATRIGTLIHALESAPYDGSRRFDIAGTLTFLTQRR